MSCNPDDDIPEDTSCSQDAIISGVMVVNEGPFTAGFGTLTVIDNTLGTIQDAFARNNCDSLLGNVVQSAAVLGNQIAVVVNNANVVYFLDATTLESKGSITGLSLPRYIVAGPDNRAYLSQWGSGGGKVSEIDLDNYTITRELSTGNGPEELAFHNGKLYVPHVGGFLSDDKVVVIDPTSMSIEKTIVTGTNPQSIVFVGDDMWVINNGQYDEFNPLPGALVKITDDVVAESYESPFGSADLGYAAAANSLFWLQFGNIYQHVLGSGMAEAASGVYYDLSVNPDDGYLYLCNAKDFNSQGDLVVMDPMTLTVIETFPTGIIPGEILFY